MVASLLVDIARDLAAGAVASAFVLVFSSTLILGSPGEVGRPDLPDDFTWRGLWIASGTITALCVGLSA